MSVILRISIRVLIFLSTRHRVVGIRDWVASLFSLLILLSVGIVEAAFLFGPLSVAPSQLTASLWWVWALASLVMLLAAFPASAYILKLRRNGITDADYSISTGIDYKAALESGGLGFDFVGVGAAKLSSNDKQFREAVQATISANKKIRLLLVDPKSEAVKRLEGHDNAVGYAETVAGSVNFIKALSDKDPQHVLVKHYLPTADADFKPFRLFFAGGDCLISPFVKGTGVDNQGRNLPQLRITEHGWPTRSSPTLYRSFERYFSEAWDAAKTPQVAK